MKKIISTPFLITISIIVGLSTLLISSNYLFEKTNEFNHDIEVIRQSTKKDSSSITNILKELPKESKVDTSGILILSKHKNRIDSILFGSSVQYAPADSIKQKLSKLNSKAFMNLNPAVFRWIIFHSVVLSLSMASLLFMLYIIANLFNEFKSYYKITTYASLLVGVLSAIAYLFYVSYDQPKILSGGELMEDFKLIFEHPGKVLNSIVFPMFLISLAPLIGILLVNIATYFSFDKNIENKDAQALQEKYKDLKDNLNIFALFLGLMVSCAVIGTGLQRDMIISHIGEFNSVLYPKELIYVYGIVFSLILALFFIPSYAYLRYAGRNYTNKNNEPGKWWEIGKDTIDNIKIVFVIILPLLSSIVQPFIKELM